MHYGSQPVDVMTLLTFDGEMDMEYAVFPTDGTVELRINGGPVVELIVSEDSLASLVDTLPRALAELRERAADRTDRES